MVDERCVFCDAEVETRFGAAGFSVCNPCKGSARKIMSEFMPQPDELDTFGFEEVDRSYSPSEGEFMYLEDEKQFYRVSINSGEGEKMIYLQPVPEDRSKIPVTEMKDVLAEAIQNGRFYRISVDGDIEDHEGWWQSALALSVSPETPDENGSSSNSRDLNQAGSGELSGVPEVDELESD